MNIFIKYLKININIDFGYIYLMRVISFDIGIKNMAYCIFDISGNRPISIYDWNVLNLLDDAPNVQYCSTILETKQPKKSKIHIGEKIEKKCSKKAKYEKDGKCFCEKHANSSSYLLPNKEFSTTSLKKMKIEDLQTMSKKYGVFLPQPIGTIQFTSLENIVIPSTKKGFLEKMLPFFEKNVLQPVKIIKKKTANDTDLVCIGKNMKKMLDEIPGISDITHVLIENQISTIATRMKTIQGMCAQYFIMKCSNDIIIEFISSVNKLKDFKDKTIADIDDGQKAIYKQHKKDGIVFCKQILEQNEGFQSWGSNLETSKKDDLADSFLQGIWYLKNRNIITYAENLKINSV
jgi:hypothetical protein